MKSFIFFCILLINTAICFGQDDFFKTGAGVNFAVTPKNHNEYIGTNICYQSYHHTPKDNFYITSGTRILTSMSPSSYAKSPFEEDVYFFTVSKRLGLAFTSKKETKHKIYYNIGSELDFPKFYSKYHVKIGIYASADILFKGKIRTWALTPEINVIHPLFSNTNSVYVSYPYILAGLGISQVHKGTISFNKPNKIKRFQNSLSADLFIAYSDHVYSKPYYFNENRMFTNISVSYRLFKRELFSPELGLIFVHSYGTTHNLFYYSVYQHINGSFAKFNEYALGLKLGGSFQTQGRVAFINNFAVYPFFVGKGLGLEESAGIKVGIAKDIALSLSFQLMSYFGDFRGKYDIYKTNNNTSTSEIIYNAPKLHPSDKSDLVKGIKLGVHF